jgi:hypothetical protein
MSPVQRAQVEALLEELTALKREFAAIRETQRALDARVAEHHCNEEPTLIDEELQSVDERLRELDDVDLVEMLMIYQKRIEDGSGTWPRCRPYVVGEVFERFVPGEVLDPALKSYLDMAHRATWDAIVLATQTLPRSRARPQGTGRSDAPRAESRSTGAPANAALDEATPRP